MYNVLSSVKTFFNLQEIIVDNAIFRLFYRFTTGILILFCIIVSLDMGFYVPITCFASKSIPDNVLNTYCWIQSTYTIPGYHSQRVGVDVAHEGVGKTLPDQRVVFHNYYQWMHFYLLFQAIVFYIPHYLWKKIEKRRIQSIVQGLNQLIIVNPTVRGRKIENLAVYFDKTMHRNQRGDNLFSTGPMVSYGSHD